MAAHVSTSPACIPRKGQQSITKKSTIMMAEKEQEEVALTVGRKPPLQLKRYDKRNKNDDNVINLLIQVN